MCDDCHYSYYNMIGLLFLLQPVPERYTTPTDRDNLMRENHPDDATAVIEDERV